MQKGAIVGQVVPTAERTTYPQAALFQNPPPQVAKEMQRQRELEKRALSGSPAPAAPAPKIEADFTPRPSVEPQIMLAPHILELRPEPRKSLQITDPVTGFTIKFPVLEISPGPCGWVILVPTDAETSFIPPMGAKVQATFDFGSGPCEETLIYFGINNLFPDRKFNVLVLQKL